MICSGECCLPFLGILLTKLASCEALLSALVHFLACTSMDPATTGFKKLAQTGLPRKAVDEAEHLCFWRDQRSHSPLAWFLTRMAASEQSGITQAPSCYSVLRHPLEKLFESVLPIGRGCIGVGALARFISCPQRFCGGDVTSDVAEFRRVLKIWDKPGMLLQ